MRATLFLEPSSHQRCLPQGRKRAVEFQEFLDYVRGHYRRWPVAMIEDENAIHCDEQSQSLAEDLDLKRSPHLNPVDLLRCQGKEDTCANWQQSSIEDQGLFFQHDYDRLAPVERCGKQPCSPQRFGFTGCLLEVSL